MAAAWGGGRGRDAEQPAEANFKNTEPGRQWRRSLHELPITLLQGGIPRWLMTMMEAAQA